jgi:hypothetical protein
MPASERLAIDTNDTWACPACVKLNENETKERTFKIPQKRAGESLVEPNMGARRTAKYL